MGSEVTQCFFHLCRVQQPHEQQVGKSDSPVGRMNDLHWVIDDTLYTDLICTLPPLPPPPSFYVKSGSHGHCSFPGISRDSLISCHLGLFERKVTSILFICQLFPCTRLFFHYGWWSHSSAHLQQRRQQPRVSSITKVCCTLVLTESSGFLPRTYCRVSMDFVWALYIYMETCYWQRCGLGIWCSPAMNCRTAWP